MASAPTPTPMDEDPVVEQSGVEQDESDNENDNSGTESEPESYYEEPADDSDADADWEPEPDHRETVVEDGEGEEGDAAEGEGEAPTMGEEGAGGENDFRRILGQVQQADARDDAKWKFEITAEGEIDFEDEMRNASGIGRRRNTRSTTKRRRRHRSPPLSHEVRHLLGRANIAYVESQYHEAITLFRSIIKIEPATPGVWGTLAQCHRELGEEVEALQLDIMGALLEEQDVDRWRDLGGRSRDMGYVQQAIYCYQQLLKIDPTDVEALWERSYLLKITGDVRRTSESLLKILKSQPLNASVLDELRVIYIENGEPERARKLFQDAFETALETRPGGPGTGTEEDVIETGKGPMEEFGLMQIIALADFYNTVSASSAHPTTNASTANANSTTDSHSQPQPQSQFQQAIQVIRRGARWLDGRYASSPTSPSGEEWDAMSDDREFDPPGHVRDGSSGLGSGPGSGGGGYSLDVNLRERLAVARLRMGDMEEAEMHASIVLASNIFDYHVLFADLADVYFDLGMYDEALKIYSDLSAQDETSSLDILLRVGACHRNMANFEDAAGVLQWALQAAPDDNGIKQQLADVYEIMGRTQEAYDLITEIIEARSQMPQDESKPSRRRGVTYDSPHPFDPPSGSIFPESSAPKSSTTTSRWRSKAQRALTREQLLEHEKAREQETVTIWGLLQASEERMMSGEREAVGLWLKDAGKIVEDFRVTRQLFQSDRSAKFRGVVVQRRQRNRRKATDEGAADQTMAESLQQDLADAAVDAASKFNEGVTAFRGISFSDWLLLTLQYAFLLTREGQYALAKEILEHMGFSNAFTSFEYQNALRFARLTCAIRVQDTAEIIMESRAFSRVFTFNNDVIRLLLASLNGGTASYESYVSTNLQKFTRRELLWFEKAIYGETTFASQNKKSKGKGKASRGRPKKAKKADEDEGSSGGDDAVASDSEEEVASGDEDAPTATKRRKIGFGPEPNPFTPTQMSPVFLAHYGQIALGAKSYQSAIYYLLQAYELQPYDPLICLSLAVACISRAMQRQADNRHHLILEGIVFMDHYRKYRKNDDLADEIEYNFGRAFHHLNLLTLALKHYQAALKLVEARLTANPEASVGCGREAAYNLSLIYMMTGAVGLADELFKKWLSY